MEIISEYKWYRIEFTDASALELTTEEQVGLLAMIREAGKRDQYRVEVPLAGRMEDFIQSMLWNQDLFRLKAVLRTAFECRKGEEFKEHNLSQVQPPYRLVVYNELLKAAEGRKHKEVLLG